MPLVTIHVIKGARSREQLKVLADAVQSVMESHFKAPAKDRFQIITQHEEDEIYADDFGLGFKRTNQLVILQIIQQGRTRETKEATYAAMAKALKEKCGMVGDDLVISITSNTPEDWSLGHGRAQVVNGDLTLPKTI